MERVSHLLQVVDQVQFLLSLSMNHASDVSKLIINQRVKKTFVSFHFELVQEASISIMIMTSKRQYAKVIRIRVHRTLSRRLSNL